jgi:hypothetical protein
VASNLGISSFFALGSITVFRKCAIPIRQLPEKRRSRWGEGLTADDMKKCVWARAKLVAQIEFLEWTASNHLRHSKFVGLREDKNARRVIKEHAGESDGIAPNPDVQQGVWKYFRVKRQAIR